MKEFWSTVEIEKAVEQFFNTYVPRGESVVFAFSGGVDSMALLHIVQKFSDWPIHVVHFDHGWRKESGSEAKILEKMVEQMGLPCKIVQLDKGKGNLEDWCRKERFRLLREYALSLGASYILLAHQADDQIEVVMKRFLEGSSVTKLRGMRPIEHRNGVNILRPLLTVRKKEMLAYLEDRFYINDPTNKDCAFLRARMREQIFPELRKSFGKDFSNSLLHIAQEAAEIETFVERTVKEAFICHEVAGGFVVFPREESDPFLIKSLIRSMQERLGVKTLSRQQIDGAAFAFCDSRSGQKRFFSKSVALYVERGFLALFTRQLKAISPIECSEQSGQCQVGDWTVIWEPSSVQEVERENWISLFQGKEQRWYIPQQPFTVCSIDKRLKPSSLRPYLPAIAQSLGLVADPINRYTVSLPLGSWATCVKINLGDHG